MSLIYVDGLQKQIYLKTHVFIRKHLYEQEVTRLLGD